MRVKKKRKRKGESIEIKATPVSHEFKCNLGRMWNSGKCKNYITKERTKISPKLQKRVIKEGV